MAERPSWKGDLHLTIATRLVVMAGGVLASVATARFLGPDGRGEYFLVTTFAATVAQFANLGLVSSNTYLVAQSSDRLGALTANSLWISLGAGLVGTVAALAYRTGGQGSAPGALGLAGLLAAITLFYMLGTNLLVGIQRIRLFNALQMASNMGVLVLLLGAGLAGFGPRGFLAACVTAWTAAGAVLFYSLRRLSGRGLAFDRSVFRDGWRYSSKAYWATLFGYLLVRSSVFWLQNERGPRELGYFSVACQVGDVLAILPQSVALLLFPRLVRSEGDRWRATFRSALGVGAVLVVCCLATAAVSVVGVRWAFGANFLPAVRMLMWLLPGAVFLGLTSVLSQYLAASGFPLRLVWVWLVGLASVTGANVLLIPRHGGAGAAAAQSLAHAVVFALVLWLCRQTEEARQKAVAGAVMQVQGA